MMRIQSDKDSVGDAQRRPSRHRDVRWLATAIVGAGILVLGYVVTLLPSQPGVRITTSLPEPRREAVFDGLASSAAERREQRETEDKGSQDPAIIRLQEAQQAIDAGRYDDALAQLDASRQHIQHLPESYLMVGVALLGKGDYETARDFFNAALDRDPRLAEGYFGYAIAAEGLGDLETALSGMRSFLHLQTDPDPYRLKVAQARSAIWEWEARLGRGEWGATQGIPPGYTEDELRRDGRGAATKIPIPGTDDENGFSRYTIKHSDRIKIFEK